MTQEPNRRDHVVFDSLDDILREGGAEEVAEALRMHLVVDDSQMSSWTREFIEAFAAPFVALREECGIALRMDTLVDRLQFDHLHGLALQDSESYPTLSSHHLVKLRDVFARIDGYKAGAEAQADVVFEQYGYGVHFLVGAVRRASHAL